MRKRKQEELKDSKIEWLGELPTDWKKVRMRYLSKIDTGDKDTQDSVEDGDYPFFVRSDTVESLDTFSFNTEAVMTSGDGAGVCKIYHHYKGKFALHQRMYAIYDFKDVIGRYIYYSMIGNFEKEVFKLSAKSTVDSLRMPMLKNFPLALPSFKEQKAITTFLDHNTEVIDQLIAKKQQLIEKLKEKRQALITQAVTKGLNQEVPMKDSGIEWLGEIPEHWNVLKIKYLFSLKTDKAPKNNDYELLSVYTDIGVEPRKDLEAKGNKASSTDGYWIVKEGDIIVNKLLAWMGAIGYSNYEGVTSPAYDILRPSNDVQSKFYGYLFRTKKCQVELKRNSYGIMDMRLRLYFSQFGQIPMPVPSKSEQEEIINFISEFQKKTDKLITGLNNSIDKLKEYRQSLISAAVTGKIDVREQIHLEN